MFTVNLYTCYMCNMLGMLEMLCNILLKKWQPFPWNYYFRNMLCFILYIFFFHWKSIRTFDKETQEPFCFLIIYTSIQLFLPLFISGRGIPLPPPTEANNTEALCRRLEQKIESLTKMGGSLQKENKGNHR